MLLYSLVILIAIGVLLTSEPGRTLLVILLYIGAVCLILGVFFITGLFGNAFIKDHNTEINTFLNNPEPLVQSVAGVILCAVVIYYAFKLLHVWSGNDLDKKSITEEINEEEV